MRQKLYQTRSIRKEKLQCSRHHSGKNANYGKQQAIILILRTSVKKLFVRNKKLAYKCWVVENMHWSCLSLMQGLNLQWLEGNYGKTSTKYMIRKRECFMKLIATRITILVWVRLNLLPNKIKLWFRSQLNRLMTSNKIAHSGLIYWFPISSSLISMSALLLVAAGGLEQQSTKLSTRSSPSFTTTKSYQRRLPMW